MKNLFERDHYKTTVLAGAILSLAAAGVAYLLLSDKGTSTRGGLKKKISSIAKDAAVNAISKKTKIKKKAVKAVADRVVKTD
ncbi:hypothetical protein [Mucilaginibacter sp. BT774]|uniref:hypothetical protein n=1 Tax=Mucilaginibacter sp. BT774 TaxID=3062276 RepID=UPI0026766BE3|nr:hypothetical protein [Mucilaginibacter sp. BT774]MDO3628578.1 hypothetical protein [Mucilaginibacter sp. BT774]